MFKFFSVELTTMNTAVYTSRFVPVLSKAAEYEKADPLQNFHREMSGRLLTVKAALERTKMLPLEPDTPILWEGPVCTIIGIASDGHPYLFRRFYSSGKTKTDGSFELIGAEGAMAAVEVGIFGERGFVDGVRSRVETNLPAWINRGAVSELYVWEMEDNYAIAMRRPYLFTS